jgi:acetolactate synthase-1/2/3 large subunit
LAGDVSTAIPILGEALRAKMSAAQKKAAKARFETRAALHEDRRRSRMAAAEAGAGAPMTTAWVSKCVSDVLGDGAVFSELGVIGAFMEFDKPGCYFDNTVAGGLGWGLPAALGFQLANRDRLVVASVGDGSYMFANPVACHQIAEALQLPLLTIVLNNGIWNAVRRSTLDVFPDGVASKANLMPITSLQPSPDFCKVAEASRAYVERVETGADLPGALARAIKVIRTEKRQALLEVITAPS